MLIRSVRRIRRRNEVGSRASEASRRPRRLLAQEIQMAQDAVGRLGRHKGASAHARVCVCVYVGASVRAWVRLHARASMYVLSRQMKCDIPPERLSIEVILTRRHSLDISGEE